MRMLLINQNPIVSKLAGLSAQKAGLEIVEEPALDTLETSGYDVLFIDDAKLEGSSPEELRSRTGAEKICLIYGDDDNRMEGFDYYIRKPFLPTEMVDLMTEIRDEMSMPKMEESIETSPEEPSEQTAEEQASPEGDVEESEEEDIEALLSSLDEGSGDEEQSSQAQEKEPENSGEEEDFDALLAAMDEGGEEGAGDEEPAANRQEKETPTPDKGDENFDELLTSLTSEEAGADETAPIEEQGAETTEQDEETLDLDALLQEVESEESESVESVDLNEENLDELLEGLDLELETEEQAPVALPETEGEGGVLDETLVSEVKELLEEEEAEMLPAESVPEEERVEEEESTTQSKTPESEIGDEAPETAEKEMPEEMLEEEMLEEETPEAVPSPSPESLDQEVDEELDLLSEEELLSVLEGDTLDEEETAASEVSIESEVQEAPIEASQASRTPDTSGSEETGALVARLLGSDPKTLRQLLAGAQITINITFPKEP